MTSAQSGPFPRSDLPWLWLLLAVHAGLLAYALIDPLTRVRADYEPRQYVVVTLVVLALAGGTYAWHPRYARAWAIAGAVLTAALLLSPGSVAVVLLLLLNAYVVGTKLLRYVGADEANGTAALPFSIPVLCGLCVWMGVIGATAALPIHYTPTYTAAVLLPLAFAWRDTQAALARAAALLRPVAIPPPGTHRAWMALLQTLIALHLFLVARPEAGYDAVTMHLQAPQLMSAAHRFAFDVTRYVWAVMPMGADWTYTAAYFLGGEAAARLANLCFGALACHLVYVLIRRHARPEIALASVTLLVSTPLAYLETGSLYVENLWSAYLLATLWVTLELTRGGHAPRTMWPALALLAAGAMQCKTIGVLWLAPLLAYALIANRRRAPPWPLDGRAWLVTAGALVFGAWPYANAWLRTGNPVFPFLNTRFRSPFFDTASAFTNPMYETALRPWSLYETIIESHRFIEGADGAAGFHWLLLLPLIFVAFARRRPTEQWVCAALAALFFAAVYSQQAYLRYLLPAFLLLTVLGGWAAGDLPDRPATRYAVLLIGGALCLVHVRFMHTGAWSNVTLCPGCAFGERARENYLAQHLPNRIVSDYLNRNLADARVGFFLLNGPAPAGFTGYSRAGNWHDVPVFRALALAQTAEDVAAVAAQYHLTHAVFRTNAPEQENAAIRAYRERYVTPVWRFQDFIVARIDSQPH
jgi:4-amino-4-deoxy-L-arabinose transferase-like glycosyltransferase